MKTLNSRNLKLIFVTLISLVSFISCDKMSTPSGYVGEYYVTMTEELSVYGSDGQVGQTKTFHDAGRMRIEKDGKDRVKVTGFIETYGEIIGPTLYLDTITDLNSKGQEETISFYPAVNNDNGMTFKGVRFGTFFDNGMFYSYSSTQEYEAVKRLTK